MTDNVEGGTLELETLPSEARQAIRQLAASFVPSEESVIEKFLLLSQQLCEDWARHMLDDQTRDVDIMLDELALLKAMAMDLCHQSMEDELEFLTAICFENCYEN